MTVATEKNGNVKVIGVDVTPVVKVGHRTIWAYLGLLGLARDEIAHLIDRLVERGTLTEKEGRKLVQDVIDWPQQGFKNAEAELQKQIEIVLERLGVLTTADLEKMNLPTRADIQALTEKVAALTKKVEQLRKAEEQEVEKTEALAAKVQASNRKVHELKKAVEEETPANNQK